MAARAGDPCRRRSDFPRLPSSESTGGGGGGVGFGEKAENSSVGGEPVRDTEESGISDVAAGEADRCAAKGAMNDATDCTESSTSATILTEMSQKQGGTCHQSVSWSVEHTRDR